MPHPSNRYSTCITIFVEEWHRVLRRWELLAHSLLQPTCEKSWVIFCWLYISLLITTGFYCQWRSQNRISHNILILQFMESRGNIGIGQRRHYRRKEHMYLGRRSDRDRRTDIKDFVLQNVEKFWENSQSFCSSRILTLSCVVLSYRKICTNMSFVSHVSQKLRYDQM